jgi:hypothetical protein
VGVAIGTLAAERTPTTLTLKVKKGKDARGNNRVTLKAKLTAEGQPLEGKTITFTTDSTLLCTETTDSNGKATCKAPGKQDKKTCYTATFAGDNTYEPSTATVCKKIHYGKIDAWPGLLDPTDVHDDVTDMVQPAMASAGLPD